MRTRLPEAAPNLQQEKKKSPDRAELYDLLYAELERMNKRQINGKPRNDSKFTILRSLVEQMQAGATFNDVWARLEDHEKFAVITRLENVARKIGMENSDQEIKLWDTTIKPLRRELGITTEVQEDGEVFEITNSDRMAELEKTLQYINKERGLI